jgi:hypothetical protein
MGSIGSGTIHVSMEAGDPPPMHRISLRPVVRVVVFTAASATPALVRAAGIDLTGTTTQLAYVDPGSGSFILQALVATLAGAAVAVNAYWAKIKRVFGRGAPEEEDDETTGSPPSDD